VYLQLTLTPFAPPRSHVQLCESGIGGWGSVAAADRAEAAAAVTTSDETEWHDVFFVTPPACAGEAVRVVVTVPSWSPAVAANKRAASVCLAATKLAPAVLGTLRHGDSVLQVIEYLSGGTVQIAHGDSVVLRTIGRLYGRLHQADTAWFAPVVPLLQQESLVPPGDRAEAWASCLWILPWLTSMVPPQRRASLAADGVDWQWLDREVAGLPESCLLPPGPRGVLARHCTVHGDSHPRNLMWDGDHKLRVIDFDLTAPGPAGSELGFLTLMLFRCGVAPSPEQVASVEDQRAFAHGYLTAAWRDTVEGSPTAVELDEFLFAAQLWSYVGMLKMGLLCAVLMDRPGHLQKREVMRARGPVLLHPQFLKTVKLLMRRALDGDCATKAAILEMGLFFAAQSEWASAVHTVGDS
jgi:hypothetical protein